MRFPVNFAKSLGTTYLQNTSEEPLLKRDIFKNSCFAEYQADCMIQIFQKYQWRSSVLVKFEHFLRHILNGLLSM